MRADVNLSVRKKGDAAFGVRTETKNVNSFRAIEHAIEFETARQIDILESGGTVKQETRHWNEDRRTGVAMRSKENAQDYRYFPDPDLPPVVLSEEYIERLTSSLPELSEVRRARFTQEYALSDYAAGRLTASKALADLFENTVKLCNEPKETANWLIECLPKALDDAGVAFEDADISFETFAEFIGAIRSKTINKNVGMKVLAAMVKEGSSFDLKGYIEKNGMAMIDDTDMIRAAVKKVLAENQKSVEEYRAGKTKVLGFLIGQVMRSLGGKANPASVNAVMAEELNG